MLDSLDVYFFVSLLDSDISKYWEETTAKEELYRKKYPSCSSSNLIVHLFNYSCTPMARSLLDAQRLPNSIFQLLREDSQCHRMQGGSTEMLFMMLIPAEGSDSENNSIPMGFLTRSKGESGQLVGRSLYWPHANSIRFTG